MVEGASSVTKTTPTSGRRRWSIIALVSVIFWAVVAPQSFFNLWLTPDQQGQLWFQLGKYDRAARAFEDGRWRGVSHYAAQDFAAAAQYFSQCAAKSLCLKTRWHIMATTRLPCRFIGTSLNISRPSGAQGEYPTDDGAYCGPRIRRRMRTKR